MAIITDLPSNEEVLATAQAHKEVSNHPSKDSNCRLCKVYSTPRLMFKGELGLAAWDRHPVSPGHFLVVPYRHFADYFDIRDNEREELWSLVAQGKSMVEEQYQPDGYNIGINVGEAAGQSIFHLHIHVIPRYKGDVENPKGGVRGVIPEKKLYSYK